MAGLLRITEAASLALHAGVMLSSHPERRFSAASLARVLGASPAHMAKVLQRLAKAGILASTRGKGGGFRLAADPARTSLLDLYRAIEGPLPEKGCLLAEPLCRGGCCILGDLPGRVESMVRERLSRTTLAQLAGAEDCLPAPEPGA